MKSLKNFLATLPTVIEDVPLIKLTDSQVIYDGDYAFVFDESEQRMVEQKNCFKGTRGELFVGFQLNENTDEVTPFFAFRPSELKFGGTLYKVQAQNIFIPEENEDV